MTNDQYAERLRAARSDFERVFIIHEWLKNANLLSSYGTNIYILTVIRAATKPDRLTPDPILR